jgi:putative membrane protein
LSRFCEQSQKRLFSAAIFHSSSCTISSVIIAQASKQQEEVMRKRRLLRALANRRSTAKGILAGIAGGLAGAWAMNQFQAVLSEASEKFTSNGSPGSHSGKGEDRQPSEESSEDATMKAAGKISMGLLRRPLSKDQKKKAGPVVHYAFGALAGGIYGAGVENMPRAKTAAGAPFGAALFLAADEVAEPLLGLSGLPLQYPWSTHAQALASHLVYGVTTEVVRKSVRMVLRFA